MPAESTMIQVPERTEAGGSDRQKLQADFLAVRHRSESLCRSLVPEDYIVQSMPDVSPTKWHLAHTSWFFETFILQPHVPDYAEFDSRYGYLFNSYYVSVGDRHCRQNRGLLSRPTVREVYDYRHHVDRAMQRFLEQVPESKLVELKPLLELGCHHEQQHQELLLMDIKHVFWVNPLRPAFRKHHPRPVEEAVEQEWVEFCGGIKTVGHGGEEFAYDNESPRHDVLLEPFQLGSRLITNGEYVQFMQEGGYDKTLLWLSDGWKAVQQEQWQSPLYWIWQDGQWWNHTLTGLRPVEPNEPVCHVSYYEADAFARWAGARLPTEQEWEVASQECRLEGHFVEAGRFHPAAAQRRRGLQQMFGELWQWTGSAYLAYPGFRPAAGAVGEYNGKFMCNQFVLRGGSCVTPCTHIRRTYRNFFYPDSRWQFGGIRLARDTA